jgi:hypothetical protein
MCASAYGLSKSNDHEKSGYYGSSDNRTGSRLSEQAKELDGYLAKACEVLSMSQWEEWGPFGKKELCAKGFWGALCMKSIARDVEASGWAQDWDDADLSEKSAHAQASLRGLFEIPPSEHDSDERCLQLLAEAKKCLDKAGVDGWRRLPGEHSVLEMAVEARAIPNGLMVRADRGCFGVGVVKKLVEMGACPSDDQAPKGRDALALCALVERKYSSSSVMKAVLSSPMGNPSKGELVSILAKGESTLSGKLVDELSAKAVGNPSMDTLVRLGLCCPDAKAVLWLGNALKSKEGEKLAPDLLGELGRARAIFAHAANFCDPRKATAFWARWQEWETANGNEESFTDMLRTKRSVCAAAATPYSAVSTLIEQHNQKQQQQQQQQQKKPRTE